MEGLIYKKDGVSIKGDFISLDEITSNCLLAKIREEDLQLLVFEWAGGRSFDGAVERVVLPKKDIHYLTELMTGEEIYFGEIAGKHSEIYGDLKSEDASVHSEEDTLKFLKRIPLGHEYDHSFLIAFHDNSEILSESDTEVLDAIFKRLGM